jgi:hypothetical protein
MAREKAPESLALFRPQELDIVLTPHTYGNFDARVTKRLLEGRQLAHCTADFRKIVTEEHYPFNT